MVDGGRGQPQSRVMAGLLVAVPLATVYGLPLVALDNKDQIPVGHIYDSPSRKPYEPH